MVPTLNEKFLLDDFHESGTKQEDFEDFLRIIDKRTSCGEYILKNLSLLSLTAKQDDPKAINGFLISPQHPLINRDVITENGRIVAPSVNKSYIPVEVIMKRGNFKELIDETLKTSRVMLYNKELSGDKAMAVFVSQIALKTLAQRLNLKATPLGESSLERDLFLAKLMNKDTHVTVVSKHFNKISKVFAVLGSEFVNTNLFMICELYSLTQAEGRYGKMECVSWDVTHKRSKILFRFPDFAEAVKEKYGIADLAMPYVEYVSSDTGENSLQVRSFWITRSGDRILGPMYSKRHRGHFENLDKIKEEIDRDVYDKFNHIPERLHKLSSIQISPDGYNPNSSRWLSKNHKCVLGAIYYILKALEMPKAIGKKRVIRLKEIYDFGVVNDEELYTAYDVLMDIFNMPTLIKERINDPVLFKKDIEKNGRVLAPLGDDPKLKMELNIAKALELDFERIRRYAAKTTNRSSDKNNTESPDMAEDDDVVPDEPDKGKENTAAEAGEGIQTPDGENVQTPA